MSYLKHSIAALLLLPCLAGAGLAEERGHRRRHEARSHPGWHGEISRFREHDMERWRGGRWHHGHHAGRLGWRWIAGGARYFYSTRVESYPDPHLSPFVVAPPAPAPVLYWYYCANPVGYYPYVPRCYVKWQAVPATVPAR